MSKSTSNISVTVSILALAVIGSVGCASESEQDVASPEINATPVVSQPLTSISRGPVKVDFIVTGVNEDKTPHIAMIETASAYQTTSPVGQLVEQHATSLEVFHALAGKDAKAPNELELAHAAETKRQGRANAAELSLTVDESALTEKSAQSCSAWVLVDPDSLQHWKNKYSLSNVTGFQYLDVSWTMEPMALGMCNESDVGMSVYWYKYDTNANVIGTWGGPIGAGVSSRLWDTDGEANYTYWRIQSGGGGAGKIFHLNRAVAIEFVII
jgi:hypothetical protein